MFMWIFSRVFYLNVTPSDNTKYILYTTEVSITLVRSVLLSMWHWVTLLSTLYIVRSVFTLWCRGPRCVRPAQSPFILQLLLSGVRVPGENITRQERYTPQTICSPTYWYWHSAGQWAPPSRTEDITQTVSTPRYQLTARKIWGYSTKMG